MTIIRKIDNAMEKLKKFELELEAQLNYNIYTPKQDVIDIVNNIFDDLDVIRDLIY